MSLTQSVITLWQNRFSVIMVIIIIHELMNVRGQEGGEKNVNCGEKCIMSDVDVRNEVKKTLCHVCDSCACRSAGRQVPAFSWQARDQPAP